MSLSNKKVLLGVTGGIAAYKTPSLVRRLAERGAEVQVVMTPGAAQFVTALSLQAVSGRPVRSDLWDRAAEAAMGHIELARWADAILIAPASADFIARLAHGLANDLLSTLCLASEAPLTLAPAMNRVMWTNPATHENVATLVRRGVRLHGPASGEQACGEIGAGRMLEPLELADALAAQMADDGDPETRPLAGRRVLITAGPTRECIDPVRYITNRSSGKMGYAVAEAALAAGAQVTLVSGPVNLSTPAGVERVDVETAAEMHAACHQRVADTDIFIAAAAVADYRPTTTSDQKIKKDGQPMQLDLTPAPDILLSISTLATRPFCVGFAAETRDVETFALGKLKKKRLDMIAANEVGKRLGFDCDDNALTVLWPEGQVLLERASKNVLAQQLVGLVAERFLLTQ